MLSTVLRGALLVTALPLAACRADGADSADGAAAGTDPPASASAAAPMNRPVAAPAEPLGKPGDLAPTPTRQDSAAAAREDVSPDWKQRERSMGSHARCLEQVAQAPPEGRARLEEACSRLPDAPR